MGKQSVQVQLPVQLQLAVSYNLATDELNIQGVPYMQHPISGEKTVLTGLVYAALDRAKEKVAKVAASLKPKEPAGIALAGADSPLAKQNGGG